MRHSRRSFRYFRGSLALESVGIGLIGTGFVGKCHALGFGAVKAVFPGVPRLRLEVLCDRSLERARDAASQFGLPGRRETGARRRAQAGVALIDGVEFRKDVQPRADDRPQRQQHASLLPPALNHRSVGRLLARIHIETGAVDSEISSFFA